MNEITADDTTRLLFKWFGIATSVLAGLAILAFAIFAWWFVISVAVDHALDRRQEAVQEAKP